MMATKPLKQQFKRSELDKLSWSKCGECSESLLWAQDRSNLKMVPLEPKPIGGSEIDPLYRRHWCVREA